jgi:aminodeoxyfutalosine deaminase
MPSPITPSLRVADITPSDFVLALPKAELHLHLEGAVEPETLVELSQLYDAEPLTREAVEALYRYHDFQGFLIAFKEVTDRLRTPEDYERITYALVRRLKEQNVLHAEVYVSVGVCLWRGQDFDALFAGMERGRAAGERDFGISLLWIFDAVRHFGPEAAQRVAEKAVQHRERNVCGFGIGGDERRAAPELFSDVFRYARTHGLHVVAHAGESAGPESILGALDALGAERIGHGLNAWQDRELMARLVEKQVPVEICITSNLRTGCCRRVEQHPFHTYFDLGMMVTLNSDDPAMFGTSLAREYQLVQDVFGVTNDQLRALARNSFQASFLPAQRKREFLALLD